MKKRLKEMMLMMLIALSFFVMLSVSVGAEEEQYIDGDYTYVVTNEKAIITDFNESVTGSITIPSTLGGYPVTTIEMWSFNSCTGLTSVTIPNSVTTIGIEAFYWCTSLTSVTIPNSVECIEYGAFRSCFSLKSITIPDSVITIGNDAFKSCTELSDVVIGKGVTTIENGVFYGCEKLLDIYIPDNVISIGNGAFFNCSGLTTITIGSAVTNIDNNAFYGCTNLKDVHFMGIKWQWNNILIGSNNSYLTNATIHCIKAYTQTNVTEGTGCKIYQVEYYWVPVGSEVTIACYNSDVLVHYETKNDNSKSFTVSNNILYDKVKIFVWDNFTSIRPITDGEEVK